MLHLDDIATHEELFSWTGRLTAQVIEPLGRGESARYAPYDWNLRAFGPPRTLPPAPVLLVEGVGAGRRELRPHLAALLWMELPARESWARGRRRDGEAQREFWDAWTEAERALRRRPLAPPREPRGARETRGVRGAARAREPLRPGPSGPNSHSR